MDNNNQADRQKELEREFQKGFNRGIIFTILMAVVSFLAWAVVFLPMGWWI